MTPAPHPFESLEEALLGVAVDPPISLLEQLVGEDGLQKAMRRVLPVDGSQLLLVIDQFEELFTQVAPGVATHFLDTLVAAITAEHSRVRLVVTSPRRLLRSTAAASRHRRVAARRHPDRDADDP